VPAGAALARYVGTLHVTTDNTVISNLEVFGDIVIDATNVTVKNTRLISETPSHALRIMERASGFTLTNSEIDGRGSTDNAIYGFGTMLCNNIHDVENGITVSGPSVIRGNFIHDLRAGKIDPHFDGIQVDGGRDIQILRNTVVNNHEQTAAVMLDNYFAGLSNIVVDGNRLIGGGYTVYVDGRFKGGPVIDSTIEITNNEIGGGRYGHFAFYDHRPVVRGNTWVTPQDLANDKAVNP
jgi:hypothetical protein